MAFQPHIAVPQHQDDGHHYVVHVDEQARHEQGVQHLAPLEVKMGEYMLNSVIVTALALALLLVVALPAAYCLSRFHFKGCKVLNLSLIHI